MGIFSSKYVHNVGTSIQRVVQDKDVVDPYLLAIMESTQSKVDLVDNLLETSFKSLGITTNNYYSFVKNKHPAKAPNAEVVLDTRFSDAVEALVRPMYPGASVRFAYTRFGPPNAYHEAWESLVSSQGYEPDTGILRPLTSGKTECVLKNIRVELPESMRSTLLPWQVENWISSEPQGFLGFTDLFGTINPSFTAVPVSFGSFAAPRVRVNYVKKVTVDKPPKPAGAPIDYEDVTPPPIITDEFYTFPLVRFGDNKEYFHTSYSVGTTRYFFTYQYKSGAYPSLDNVLDVEQPLKRMGEFYPNIYFRLNKAPATDPIYKKMSQRLDINYDKLLDGINANPDIGDVQSAILNLGLNADSTHEMDCAYLFDFFQNIRNIDSNRPWNPDLYLSSWLIGHQGTLHNNKNAVVLRDDVFTYSVVYDKITSISHAGSIGKVGYAVGGKGTETRQRNETYETVVGDGIEYQTRVVSYTVPYRFYKKQISLSFWEEVRIYDLTMVYDVAGKNGEYKTTLGDDSQEICLIPLDRVLVKKYSLPKQQELLTRSFNFVFNSYVIQKVKWYQQSWFGDLLKIVGVVLMFFGFFGSEGLFAGLSGLSAYAAAQLIVKRLIYLVAVQVGVKLFVKIVGPEFAFIAALAAMAFGFYGEQLAYLSPDKLLNLAAMVFDGVTTYIGSAFQDLQAEMETFASLKTEGEKELERAMDLLTPKVHPIAPILLGETPDQFLYRALIFGVSEFTKLNQVSDFVERALYLPTTGSSFEMM